jgi:2-amino-4-hydroxy-6-hydroxymethyldihydropteridine diphosphokinase
MNVVANSGVLAFIALGSNMGEREKHLQSALQMLGEHPRIQVLRLSSIYETEPVGYLDQPAFLNAVAAVRTDMKAGELLGAMLDAELKLGRTRDIRFGPRTIDLDLLLFGSEVLTEPELIVPHPRMLERAFVLVPLLDVLEEAAVPGLEEPLSAYLDGLEGKEGVTRWNTGLTNN